MSTEDTGEKMTLYNNSMTITENSYDYLEEINYEMSNIQFDNFTTLVKGLITVRGCKSVRRISTEVFSAKSNNTLYKHLKASNWDEELQNYNRINYLYNCCNNKSSSEPSFLIIDDTVNAKKKSTCIEGLCYNLSYTEGKNIWSKCI